MRKHHLRSLFLLQKEKEKKKQLSNPGISIECPVYIIFCF